MITSSANARIKQLIQLQNKAKTRESEGLFVCEGRKMFDELRRYRPDLLQMTYISESFYTQMKQTEPDYLAGISYEVIQDSVFREAAQTVTPQGILALAEQPSYRLEDILREGRLRLLFLENLQDPGNLGTILRTAEGAGMDAVLLSRDSVDIFNPKVIRSTMGSIFRMPFYYAENTHELLDVLKKHDISLYAAALTGAEDFDRITYADRMAILIGNEANGLTDSTIQQSDARIRIPMYGKVESLNAAVAAALIMYQSRKNNVEK